MKPSKVYRLLVGAGFPAGAAVVMTAIAGAESGWNPNAVGDVSLETREWGPSVGLFQIRTLKAQTGTGGPRDIRRLRNNPAAQAQAAHEIWAGSGFGAWSTYKSGAYRSYLSPATKASGGRASAAAAGGAGGTEQAFSLGGGGLLNPLNWPGAIGGALGGAAGDAAGNAATMLWQQVQPFVLTMTFATAGLGLVVIGITVTARPVVDRVSSKVDEIKGQAQDAAKTAAEAGMVVA